MDAGREAGRPGAPGDGALHSGGGPAYRHGAGASGASAIDGENLESVGADRAAERCSDWTSFPGDSSNPEPRSESSKEFSRALKNPKRLKGLKPWSRNRTKPPETPAAEHRRTTPQQAASARSAGRGSTGEDWNRGFRESRDARRAGEVRRTRGGRRQIAATASGHRRRGAADRRRDCAGIQARGSGRAQGRGGDESPAAQTARRGIERHDRGGFRWSRMGRPCLPDFWKMCPLERGSSRTASACRFAKLRNRPEGCRHGPDRFACARGCFRL